MSEGTKKIAVPFAPVPEELLLEATVGATAVRLYALMARKLPGDWLRSRRAAAEALGVSIPTAARALKELESAGWARRVEGPTEQRATARWRVLGLEPYTEPRITSEGGCITSDTGVDHERYGGRITSDTQEGKGGKERAEGETPPASQRGEASEASGPQTYAAAGAAGKSSSDENSPAESEDEQRPPSGFAANQNRTVLGTPGGGEANPPCEDAERGRGSAARTQNESTGAEVEVVAIDRTGDDDADAVPAGERAPATEAAADDELTLDERYQAFPSEPVEVTDRQAGQMAKEAVAYYIDWRHQAGLGDPKVKTWVPQMGSSVKQLIRDKQLAPQLALDALLEWHDVNTERATAGHDPLRPGAIITIGARLAEAGGARHGVNGRGLSRAQQAEHARKDAVADLLTALREQGGEVEQGAA